MIKYLPILLLSACGGIEHSRVTDFRLYCPNCTMQESQMLVQMVNAFNNKAQAKLLKFSLTGNSPIYIQKDLTKSADGVLGHANRTGYKRTGFNHKLKSTYHEYMTMTITLDKDYINDPLVEWDSKLQLFYHEVGHGLKFQHSDDTSDLMFPVLLDNPDVSDFFTKVHTFISHLDSY